MLICLWEIKIKSKNIEQKINNTFNYYNSESLCRYLLFLNAVCGALSQARKNNMSNVVLISLNGVDVTYNTRKRIMKITIPEFQNAIQH